MKGNHINKSLANTIENSFSCISSWNFFHFSEKWNIFSVFTQRPLTFLPVSCRIDVGHNDYGYQQPSYPEQGYDRPYEDSSQHYYEGGIYIPSHTYAHTFPFLPHLQREQKFLHNTT